MRGITARRFVIVANAGLPLDATFVQQEQDLVRVLLPHACLDAFSSGPFLLIEGIRAMDVAAPAFVMDS